MKLRAADFLKAESLELTLCGFSNFAGLQVPWADAFVAAGVCGMLLCEACYMVESQQIFELNWLSSDQLFGLL